MIFQVCSTWNKNDYNPYDMNDMGGGSNHAFCNMGSGIYCICGGSGDVFYDNVSLYICDGFYDHACSHFCKCYEQRNQSLALV